MHKPTALSLSELHEEVVEHFRRCQSREEFLSDTWAHTLSVKGALYSEQTMTNMLMLGNKVNSWIDDFNYLIDATILDLTDPVVQKLLAFGQSDFGRPRKDIVIGGQRYTSNFIHLVFYATRIIHAIEERGIAEPRVLEIGGGLGAIAYLLRAYYGSRLTFYVVDLPSTLLIQEWYLRACFPEAVTTFKAADAHVEFKQGAFNFINAYVIESQDTPFDVAININSMQEMDRAVVETYLRYIERNISPNGLFYFQNNFGHTSSPVEEPSEYKLDANWTLRAVEAAYQIDCAQTAEQCRIVFWRTPQQEDVNTRRLVLRVLWNGFCAGSVPNSAALVDELRGLPARYAPDSAVGAIADILQRQRIAIPREQIERLRESIYFGPQTFVEFMGPDVVPIPGTKDHKQLHTETLWAIQSSLLQLMKKSAAADSANTEELCDVVRATVQTRFQELRDTARSEFWSGHYGGLLLATHSEPAGRELLMECAARSENQCWLVRFAYLLSRFQLTDDARRVLQALTRFEPLDSFVALKAAELEHALGNPGRAVELLGAVERENSAERANWLSLAKTAVRTGNYEIARRAALRLINFSPQDAGNSLLAVLEVDHHAPDFDAELMAANEVALEHPQVALRYAAYLFRNGDATRARHLVSNALANTQMDYFQLGQAGRVLQEAGMNDLADEVLVRSMELRPRAFLHYDFVGNVYLGAGRYCEAEQAYGKALSLKPYLRHINAKHLYCLLPPAVRDARVFGDRGDLGIIFQRQQNFYHDLGAATK